MIAPLISQPSTRKLVNANAMFVIVIALHHSHSTTLKHALAHAILRQQIVMLSFLLTMKIPAIANVTLLRVIAHLILLTTMKRFVVANVT